MALTTLWCTLIFALPLANWCITTHGDRVLRRGAGRVNDEPSHPSATGGTGGCAGASGKSGNAWLMLMSDF